MDTEEILEHYLSCALWSTPCEERKLDGLDSEFSTEDVSTKLKAQSLKDICNLLEFLTAAGVKIKENSESQFGHDFWLTRNGHGAGFWDGEWDTEEDPELGDKITNVIKSNFFSCRMWNILRRIPRHLGHVRRRPIGKRTPYSATVSVLEHLSRRCVDKQRTTWCGDATVWCGCSSVYVGLSVVG